MSVSKMCEKRTIGKVGVLPHFGRATIFVGVSQLETTIRILAFARSSGFAPFLCTIAAPLLELPYSCFLLARQYVLAVRTNTLGCRARKVRSLVVHLAVEQ